MSELKTERPDTFIGEIVAKDGHPTGVRKSDVLAMLDLSTRVESSAEIMKLAGPAKSWHVGLNAFLDLFDAPHNVSELWVWNRFRHAFGGDTWQASDILDLLVEQFKQMLSVTVEWRNCSRLSWIKKRQLEKRTVKAAAALFTTLAKVVQNIQEWPDRDGFEQFSKR